MLLLMHAFKEPIGLPRTGYLGAYILESRQEGVKNGRISVSDAGWSSLAARRAHNPKVVGSNPAPATKQ
jgi:hypothetical protein